MGFKFKNEGDPSEVRTLKSKDGKRVIKLVHSPAMSRKDFEVRLELARQHVRQHDERQREARAAIERQHRNS